MPSIGNLSNLRRRLLGARVSTVASLALVLALTGAAALLALATADVCAHFRDKVRVTVLFRDGVDERTAQSLCSGALSAVPGVAGVEYVSRQRGEEEMSRLLGPDFLEVFGDSPVPLSAALSLRRGYVSPDSLARMKARLEALPGVDEAQWQGHLVEALSSHAAWFSLAPLLLAAFFLLVSLLWIAGTVRLDLRSRRIAVFTMFQVGATRGFICRPFVLRCALQGLFAALLGMEILVGVLWVVRDSFPGLLSFFPPVRLLSVLGGMALFGAGICALCAAVVVSGVVRGTRDALYAY